MSWAALRSGAGGGVGALEPCSCGGGFARRGAVSGLGVMLARPMIRRVKGIVSN